MFYSSSYLFQINVLDNDPKYRKQQDQTTKMLAWYEGKSVSESLLI